MLKESIKNYIVVLSQLQLLVIFFRQRCINDYIMIQIKTKKISSS